MKLSFPWLALGIGVLLALTLLAFRNAAVDTPDLPLLAALLISEFGLMITLIAALMGVRDLVRQGLRQPLVILLVAANLLLTTFFLSAGIALWPSAGGAPN